MTRFEMAGSDLGGWLLVFLFANLCLFSNVSNFVKADCSIFALLVGRSVGITINFFQYIQAYKPFTNPVPIHTNSTNFY